MVTAVADRVRLNTAESINESIRCATEQNVARVAQGGHRAIERRLAALDQEWDIERYLETVAPMLTLTGITLGLTTNRRWFALPIVVQTFFLQHALQGWCPPLPMLRSFGIRTMEEIDEERNALKALRGDYDRVSRHSGQVADRAVEAARR